MKSPSIPFYVVLICTLTYFEWLVPFTLVILFSTVASVLIKFCNLKWIRASYAENNTNRLSVLVTGTSTGIGKNIAITLAKKNLLVFSCVRNKEDGDNLIQSTPEQFRTYIVPIILDVTVEDHIYNAVEFVEQRLKSDGRYLYAVVNNAGIQIVDAMEDIPMKKLRHGFDVNVFGGVAVTKAFLPLMRQCSQKYGARLIFIGSLGAFVSMPFFAAYTASKQCVEGIADGFRMELSRWNIKTTVIEPGNFESNIIKHFDYATESKEHAYDVYTSKLKRFVKSKWFVLPGPQAVGDLVENVLFARFPPCRTIVGADATLLMITHLIPDSVMDFLIMTLIKVTQV